MSVMRHVPACAGWGLGIAVILLGPIVLIFAIPVGVGIGLDLFDAYGEAPVMLALCAPVAFVLLRRVSPRALVRQFAASLVRPRLPVIGRPG